jgi:hypothetical protein
VRKTASPPKTLCLASLSRASATPPGFPLFAGRPFARFLAPICALLRSSAPHFLGHSKHFGHFGALGSLSPTFAHVCPSVLPTPPSLLPFSCSFARDVWCSRPFTAIHSHSQPFTTIHSDFLCGVLDLPFFLGLSINGVGPDPSLRRGRLGRRLSVCKVNVKSAAGGDVLWCMRLRSMRCILTPFLSLIKSDAQWPMADGRWPLGGEP